MNFELTREDVMIKDAIRDWVSKECTRDVVSELDGVTNCCIGRINGSDELSFS